MDNSIYVMLSRQTALFRKMESVANNVANMNTTGFQAEKTMFNDYLVDNGQHRKIAFTEDTASYHDTVEGPLDATGNPLDVAIRGEGFFVVQTPAGNRYTRAGNLQLDGQGTLTTAAGYPVLDEGGQPLQFNPDDSVVSIGENGSVVVNGEERGRLNVVNFDNTQDMVQEGNTLYKTDQTPAAAANSRVLQGVLEKSNVEGIREVVDLTEVNRSSGNTSKFIEVMYDLQRKANNVYAQQQGG
jgi:flagellar basal-body rod protein FlgF